MLPLIGNKISSPDKSAGSNRNKNKNKKGGRRFRKHTRTKSDQEVDGNDGRDDAGDSAMEEGVSSSGPHGPLQPQSLPQISNITPRRNNNHKQNIDDGYGEYTLKPSTSSNDAVLAGGYSSSATDSASKIGSVASPLSSPLSSPSTPRQIPLSPTSSLRSIYYQRSRAGTAGSSAIETPKDKIDDDAYGAWWFLASVSESFDTATGQQKNSQQGKKPSATTNGNSGEAQNVSETGDNDRPSNHSGATLEMPSLPSTSRHATQKRKHQQQNNPPATGQVGGEYTLKEQQLRKEWLAKDALGGTLDYDQPASTPYHYIPPQNQNSSIASIAPNQNLSLSVISRSEDNIEWTPQDSSYGAAVPAFGWIPKRIRKLLEIVFVVIITALLIFFVTKTGMRLKSSGTGGGEDIYFEDDDHYLAFNDDGRSSQGSDSNHSDSNDSDSNDSYR